MGLGVLVWWMAGATFVMERSGLNGRMDGIDGWMDGCLGTPLGFLSPLWVIHTAFVFGGVY